ncbi:hypothetical protein AAY473_034524 [Plecturocebus cupreus]
MEMHMHLTQGLKKLKEEIGGELEEQQAQELSPTAASSADPYCLICSSDYASEFSHELDFGPHFTAVPERQTTLHPEACAIAGFKSLQKLPCCVTLVIAERYEQWGTEEVSRSPCQAPCEGDNGNFPTSTGGSSRILEVRKLSFPTLFLIGKLTEERPWLTGRLTGEWLTSSVLSFFSALLLKPLKQHTDGQTVGLRSHGSLCGECLQLKPKVFSDKKKQETRYLRLTQKENSDFNKESYQSVEKLSSMKLVPDPQKVGGCCYRVFQNMEHNHEMCLYHKFPLDKYLLLIVSGCAHGGSVHSGSLQELCLSLPTVAKEMKTDDMVDMQKLKKKGKDKISEEEDSLGGIIFCRNQLKG